MIYKKEKEPIEMIKVDENGHFLETVSIYEQSEITEYIVSPWDREVKFYFPIYDFELKDWVEGLSEEEITNKKQEETVLAAPIQYIQKLEQENEDLKSRLETTEMAIITLMDLMPTN